MAAKIPVKALYTGSDATALSEFESGDYLDIANGGTGASTAADARSALGLEVGADIQAYDANLPTWPSTVSATEVGYLDGVSSAIQTQLDAKATKGFAIGMSIVFGG